MSLSTAGITEITYSKSSQNLSFVLSVLIMVKASVLMMVANFFPWWNGSLIIMRQSFIPFRDQANYKWSLDGIAHSSFTFIIRCTSAPEKRIAWALLSQLYFACQLGLTEGGNVDFVPGKFRNNKSSTFMRSICVVPVNKHVDVPCNDVQR